jgi:exopolyphosphatase/guanosine-5'-triphosphate,3'-diphosphate pyrophosphatase
VADDNLAGNSYHIIKTLKIPGVDNRMLFMAASVVFEANRTPESKEPQEYATMPPAEKLTIRKLAAISRISKALDAGGNRHIVDMDIDMGQHMITVYANAEREPYLEMYTFDNQKQLFIETFGISIELRAKVNYE